MSEWRGLFFRETLPFVWLASSLRFASASLKPVPLSMTVVSLAKLAAVVLQCVVARMSAVIVVFVKLELSALASLEFAVSGETADG